MFSLLILASRAGYPQASEGKSDVVVAGPEDAAIGARAEFTSSVAGVADAPVLWSIRGFGDEEDGTISATGVYTPPEAVPTHNTITIVATSAADPADKATARLTILNPVPEITLATAIPGTPSGLLLNVTGTGFNQASVLEVDGNRVPSTLVSSTEITYTLGDAPAAGSPIVLSVLNQSPGSTRSGVYALTAPAKTPEGGNSTAAPEQGTQESAAATPTQTPGENPGPIPSNGQSTPAASMPARLNSLPVVPSSASTAAASQPGATKGVNTTSALSTTAATTQTATVTPMPAPVTQGGLPPEGKVTDLPRLIRPGLAEAGSLFAAESSPGIVPALPTTLASGSQHGLTSSPAHSKQVSSVHKETAGGGVAVALSGSSQAGIGTKVQYTASVTGNANTAVTWSVASASPGGKSFGSISSTGLYTPPPAVPSDPRVAIMATSKADATKTSTVQVTIVNPVPAISAVAVVSGSANSLQLNVTGGNFIPSSKVQFQGARIPTAYVSATVLTALVQTAQTAGSQVSLSVVNPNLAPTQSTNFNLTLPGSVGVTVVGQGQVAIGSTAQFFAAVTGTPDTAVTWSLGAGSAGTISDAGVYTPPATATAPARAKIIATSQIAPSQYGTAILTVVGTSTAAAARLLEQATFGPTDADIAHVQSIGLDAYLDEQIAAKPTLMPLLVNPLPAMCANDGHVCNDLNFYNNAITAPDQLRQRVAFALGEIFVVSRLETNDRTIAPYVNNLVNDAFGNWFKIMEHVTLSPAMGSYLNMVNSAKAPAGQIANENFARENLQLFNIGLNLLNQDGTVQTDGQGNPIPAYTESQVEAFAKAFTGWTWADADGSTPSVFPNWNGSLTLPLTAVESRHDTTSKTLLNSTLPAGQTAEQDVAGALADVFNHPNVGPFVCAQLIRHLVKSNPSPAYVGRVAAVFANDGKNVRGNMAAVVKAILLDEEARAGDVAPVATDGHLREPILWTTSVLRALGAVPKATVTDNSAYNAVPSMAAGLGEMDFQSPTVFNFFPADWQVQGTNMFAPEFALETSATIMVKLSLANSIVDNLNGRLTIDLSATGPLGLLAAASNDALLDELNKLLMHGEMSSQMRSTIASTLSGIADPAQRVRMAVYLVITSTQYKIIH